LAGVVRDAAGGCAAKAMEQLSTVPPVLELSLSTVLLTVVVFSRLLVSLVSGHGRRSQGGHLVREDSSGWWCPGVVVWPGHDWTADLAAHHTNGWAADSASLVAATAAVVPNAGSKITDDDCGGSIKMRYGMVSSSQSSTSMEAVVAGTNMLDVSTEPGESRFTRERGNGEVAGPPAFGPRAMMECNASGGRCPTARRATHSISWAVTGDAVDHAAATRSRQWFDSGGGGDSSRFGCTTTWWYRADWGHWW
jgi:hypothetical protein